MIATGFGSGLLPWAPGTMGTVVAVGIFYGLNAFRSPGFVLLVWIAIFWVGLWATRAELQSSGKSDPGYIVVDEILGYGITAATAGTDLRLHALAFVAFRVFDIAKPWPISALDRWSKKQSKGSWRAAFGVIVDDLAAGVAGFLIVEGVRQGVSQWGL